MTAVDEWADRVSELSKIDAEEVVAILEEAGIPRGRTLPARHRLRVQTVHFAGVKNLRSTTTTEEATFEPFAFTHQFQHPVSAFMTRHRNLAGKSAILDVLLWGLRGTTSMPGDVRGWLSQAAVEFTIDSDRFLAIWAVNEGAPTGRYVAIDPDTMVDWAAAHNDADEYVQQQLDDDASAASTVSDLLGSAAPPWRVMGTFDGDAAFKSAAADLVGGRLGFEPMQVFKKNPNASDDDDGKLVTQDWAKWSQGLFISGNPIRATIGEEPMLGALLLQMYLATAWGPAATTAKARRRERESLTATDRRRAAADLEAREAILSGLLDAEEELTDELEALGGEVDLAELDSRLAAVQTATTRMIDLDTNVNELARVQFGLQRDVAAARADEIAAHEAKVTQQFWHNLKPSCCPRCDTEVDAARWAREETGQCSLCDADLGAAPQPAAVAVASEDEDADDALDASAVTRERVAALEGELVVVDNELRDATAERDRAAAERTLLADAARQDQVGAARRRDIQQQLATLRGRILERSVDPAPNGDLVQEQRIIAVLKAAAEEAKRRSDKERNDTLARVSTDITDTAQRLGFTELRSAVLDGGTKLPVSRGGEEKVAFGRLREGEKLRLKIALVIALLRAGEQVGIGRHPGLLIIDSIGREEMDVSDIRQVLIELGRLATEHDVQIITTSAQGDVLHNALPPGAIRSSRKSDDRMW